jgi:pyruvate,water dikinase
MSGWIVHFDDSPPKDVELRELLGGKGAGLLEMTRDGFPVPPGFTITVPCCERYVELDRRCPDDLDGQLREAMERLEAATGRRFGDGERRLLVSVRSGAAVSMPGMMDTILDCGSSDDPWGELRDAISAVFDSFSSDRAHAYRQRHGLRGIVGTAVNVQSMFPSEVSGVLFSIDPSGLDDEHIVIESARGLGEIVVSGEVTPDRYRVRRADLAIVEATLGDDADGATSSLSEARTRTICELGLRLENLYGHPVDVEWAVAGKKIGVLQVRSIRGLDIARDVEIGREEEAARLAKIAGSRRRVWAIHNLAETLRFPTPLTWDVMRRFMSGNGGFGLLYRRLGYRPSARVMEEGFLELIGGRIYADPERLAELFWDGLPLAYDADTLRSDLSALERAPGRFDAERADGRFLRNLPANLFGMWRASRRARRKRNETATIFTELTLPRFLSWVDEQSTSDLGSLSDSQLVDLLDRRIARVLESFGASSLEPGFFGGLAFASLSSRLRLVLGDSQGAELATTLVRGLDGDTTYEQDALLFDVAQDRARMSEFLERFGHRTVGEMELAEPRWREDPESLAPLIATLKGAGARAPRDIHAENVAARDQADSRLPELLEEHGAASLREEIERDIADARRLLPFREVGKHFLMLGYEQVRRVTEELSRRWDLGRRLYFLRLSELRTFSSERGHLEDEIERRRVRWESLQRLDLPDFIDSSELESFGRPREIESTDELSGTPIASGVAVGVARVVLDVREARDLGSGYVLVCPSTDPGWTPLFLHAAALVVERGGLLSHGAIVARDFGIPAVVCPDATRILMSGQTVRVDGASGTISIVEEALADA